MKHASLLLTGFFISTAAMARQAPKDLPECQDIVKQCEQLGFEPGEHKANGKGLWADCIVPKARGEDVKNDKGVALSSTKDQAAACLKAAKMQRGK